MGQSGISRWLSGLPFLRPGSGSLRRQLLLWLLLPQLVLWVVAAAINYQVSLRHVSQAIDESLALASRALARQIKPLGQGLLIDFPLAAQAILQADPQDPFYYMASTPPGDFILGYPEMPPRPTGMNQAVGETVFYDAEIQLDKVSVPVRAAALLLIYGEKGKLGQPMLVQVARSSTNHRALARRILIDTVLPLSALIAMMSLIVGAGVKAGLAPLARLRALVEGRKPTDLAPLRLDEAPPELRSLAGAINDLLAAVQGNLVAQRRFLNDAAHQLRTPLAGLKSQTEVALAEATDPLQKARLQRVHDSANRAAHLVAQLLALARADPEAASAIARAPVDLRALAREVTSEWVPRALHAGIDLGFDESNQRPCVVEGAALLLREAMSNVIDNAVRYAGAGTEVTVSVAADGAQAIFEVTDNGPGIPADFRATVFDRFVRATDQGSGCGLGLAIVREVAQRHGGSAGLVERDEPGTTVQLRLPISARTTPASSMTQR